MRIQLASLIVNDQDRALKFYTEVLGFVLKHDIPMGGPYRWLTVISPEGHDDVEPDDEAMDVAAAAFLTLVGHVEAAQAVGAIVGGSSAELAQRAWGCIHGAVSLELRYICFVDDTDAHYDAVVETVLAGLSPAAGIEGIEGPLVRPKSGAPLSLPR